MATFDRNYFTPRSEQSRAQCKVTPHLPDDARFAAWLKHWTVTAETVSPGPYKPVRVDLRVNCDLNDVVALRRYVDGWDREQTVKEAVKQGAAWLRLLYADAFIAWERDLVTVSGDHLASAGVHIAPA